MNADLGSLCLPIHRPLRHRRRPTTPGRPAPPRSSRSRSRGAQSAESAPGRRCWPAAAPRAASRCRAGGAGSSAASRTASPAWRRGQRRSPEPQGTGQPPHPASREPARTPRHAAGARSRPRATTWSTISATATGTCRRRCSWSTCRRSSCSDQRFSVSESGIDAGQVISERANEGVSCKSLQYKELQN